MPGDARGAARAQGPRPDRRGRPRPAAAYDGPRDPDALLEHFGHGEFRAGQREAVEAALAGRDSLVVMPTGGGKSLCYQLPGHRVQRPDRGRLAADRADGRPVPQARSRGATPRRWSRREWKRLRSRTRCKPSARGDARIVFCSPERFASPSFLTALSSRTVDLFAVDEAHCVSEWGHDFRPDYLRLRGVIDGLGSPAVMACTATATEQVAEEIQERLGLRDPFVVRSGFDRPNLSFDVIALEGTGSKARKQMLLSAALADGACRPSIVYCGTRRDTEEVGERLRAEGLQAVSYHAGMPPDERASAQHRFMEGDADVVVATNAFGMGVDKADVRSVIHWAIPKSVEAYYQEAGRAGRDGRPARAILLAMRADLGRLVNFIKRDQLDADEVLAYVRRLRAAVCDGDTGRDRHPARRQGAHLSRGGRARRDVRACTCARWAARGDARRLTCRGPGRGDLQGRARPRLAGVPSSRGVRLTVPDVQAACPARSLRRHAGRAVPAGAAAMSATPAPSGSPIRRSSLLRSGSAGSRRPPSSAGCGRRAAARCTEGVAHASQRRQARIHRRSQQHARVDRGAEALDPRSARRRSRESGRRSSSGTASRCWPCWPPPDGQAPRARRGRAAPQPTSDYTDAEGNVLTLRDSVSAGTVAKLQEPVGVAASSRRTSGHGAPRCCSSASP